MSEFGKKFRFNPEVSLGHILEVILVIIPLTVYLAKLDMRVATTEKNVNTLVEQDAKKTESISLLRQNQAVLAALFDLHVTDKTKVPVTKTP